MKVSVVIPTRNGGELWIEAVNAIKLQSQSIDKIVVIDSSSSDGSFKVAVDAGFDVTSITPVQFNHGGTRNSAAKMCLDCDILVFLTQDALLADRHAIKFMVDCFSDPSVAAVCGHQIPHDNANPLAIHARLFNYPAETVVRSAADISRLGIKAAFMSNSFSAYRTKVFHELGTFPQNTILAEDMYLTAKIIKAGYRVAYCAEAIVKHSHNYTPWEEFKRYFDTGVFHASEPWIREQFGSAGGEGGRYIRSELAYLWRHAPLWIPRAMLTNMCKIFGYKLGQKHKYLSCKLVRKLSMHKSYWSSMN